MKAIISYLIFVLISTIAWNAAYAESSVFEIKGNGIGILNSVSPQLYTSSLRMTLSDSSSIAVGLITVRGGDLYINAKAVTQEWKLSHTDDGSFHAEGPAKTRQNTLYTIILDGNRIFTTSVGSVWKVSASMEGDGKKFSLQYLVSGRDPFPTAVSSLTQKVIIPNGNSNQANTGFYVPLHLEIIRGTAVIWENQDNIGHTVQSQDNQGRVISLFNSNVLKTGETFSYKFDKAGTYHYFCTIHPWRVGSVTVS